MSKGAWFWVEIVCSECLTTRQGEFVRSRIPVRALSKEAASAGWLMRRDGGWLCPVCVKTAPAQPEDADGASA